MPPKHGELSTARPATRSLSNDICMCIKAGSNDLISRNAARRAHSKASSRVPHCRLDLFVGASFAAIFDAKIAAFTRNFAIAALELRTAIIFRLHATTNIRTAGVLRFRYEANYFNLQTAQPQR
jgi:hypothetical protein